MKSDCFRLNGLAEALVGTVDAGVGAALVIAAGKLVSQKLKPTSKPKAFVADHGVASALEAMGYPALHVATAQHATRSNNMMELSNWLIENNKDLIEDEEMQVAMWMSLQPPDTDENKEENEVRVRQTAD